SPLLCSSNIFVRCPPARLHAGGQRTYRALQVQEVCSSNCAARAARLAYAVPVGRGMCPRAAAAQRRSTRRDSHSLPCNPSTPESPPSQIPSLRSQGPDFPFLVSSPPSLRADPSA